MSVFNILMKETITINRPTAGEGELSPEGKWIPSTTLTPIPMLGSIQPYTSTDITDGREVLPFKDGYDSAAARTVFTDQLTQTVSRKLQHEPDEIEFEGDTWVCWRVYNYLNSPLESLRHCESVFVKRDALRT